MILAPLSHLYGWVQEVRARLYRTGRLASEGLACPVVSVGNLTFGGTGKTPFVDLLARRFRFEGRRPAILSRGYGRRSRGVVVVSRGEGPLVDPAEGGDEPVALARRLPGVIVVVGERRADAAREAERLGANLHLLDDGYQHLALRRDVNLLLLDAREPFAGGRLPPRGRLREPLSALERADAFVFTRVDRAPPLPSALRTLAVYRPEAPVFTARIRAAGLWDEAGSPVAVEALASHRLLAVSGIARPDSFVATLTELDLVPEETLTFRDHHRYTVADLARIERAAARSGSSWIVTTEKDAVKLAGRLSPPVLVVRLAAEVLESAFFPFVSARLGRLSAGREAG